MSAAAVIAIRRKRIFAYLRDRQAFTPETAIPQEDIPYADRWYFQRLVEYGAIKRIHRRCYLDETLVQKYWCDRRKRAFWFSIVVIVMTLAYLLFVKLF